MARNQIAMNGRKRRFVGPPAKGKKPKRSKNHFKHKNTVVVAPVPNQESDHEQSSSESSDEEGQEAVSNYDQLLAAFKPQEKQEAAIESDDTDVEEEEEEVTSEDDSTQSEEIGDIDAEEEDEQLDDQSSLGEESEIATSEDEHSQALEESSNNDLKDEDEDEEEDAEDEQLIGTAKDPFIARLELELPPGMSDTLQDKSYDSTKLRWKAFSDITVSVPAWNPPKQKPPVKNGSKINLAEVDPLDSSSDLKAEQLQLCKSKPKLLSRRGLDKACVKNQLLKNFEPSALTNFQLELLSLFNSYKDVSFCQRTLENGEALRFAYTLHLLNHILKTRTKIVKNNLKLQKGTANGELRDQGLCRPKVLVVLPFRDSVSRVVNLIIKLLFGQDEKGKVHNKSRFDDEFLQESRPKGNKPDDFYDTFAGNIDDAFRLGLSITKKSLKLYSDFYASDVILASPLGLRMIIGTEEDRKREYDFLNSIELLIMDQMDIFAMQNWEHVTHLFSHLHLQPTDSHGVDYSRVRLWSLNHMSQYYRQTLLFSHVQMPEINALFNKSCHNFAGRLKIESESDEGTISQILVSTPIVFHRFDSKSVKDSLEDRFKYFTNKVMPEYKKDMMFHTCVVVPSYFDYVKVRNWFNTSDLDFLEICEYTKDNKIAKARDLFFHGEVHFLLYTERIHFYRRLLLKGIRHLIFYQLPQYPHFFSEMCNFLQAANQNRKGGSDGNMTITVLHCKYDMLRLVNVIGTGRAKHMLQTEKNVHMFVSGGAK